MADDLIRCPCCDGEGYFYNNEQPPYPWGDMVLLEVAKRENERLREALEWISANDDAGDMMFHAPGPFAKRARAALATDQKGGE